MTSTFMVRLWALRNVFLLWFVKPRVLEINEERCVVRLPLNWRTNNHVKSMYIGALCIGADVAGGLISFHMMEKRGVRLVFLFKDLRCEFFKRADGDVHFTNVDGPAIREMVDRAIATGERAETLVHVTATVPSKYGDEPVAKFEMTLSVKKKS